MPRKYVPKPKPVAAVVVTREVDGEPEQHCNGCSTWWPATGEFFFARGDRPGVLSSRCRACERDYQAKAYQQRAKRSTASPSMQVLAGVPWLSVTVLPPSLLHLSTNRSQA
jgi:hypothetical protein